MAPSWLLTSKAEVVVACRCRSDGREDNGRERRILEWYRRGLQVEHLRLLAHTRHITLRWTVVLLSLVMITMPNSWKRSFMGWVKREQRRDGLRYIVLNLKARTGPFFLGHWLFINMKVPFELFPLMTMFHRNRQPFPDQCVGLWMSLLYGYLEVRDWVERPIRPYFLSPIGAKGSGHKLRARDKYNPLARPFHGWVMSLGWQIAHPTSR